MPRMQPTLDLPSHSGATGALERKPSPWQSLVWAGSAPTRTFTARFRLMGRTLAALLGSPKAMRHWMTVAYELHARGVVTDLPAEYLRAVQPYVRRNTSVDERIAQLIDHMDWLETAFVPQAFAQLSTQLPLVLLELPPLPGYDYMRLQLRRAPLNSPEGDLLLALTVRRSPDVQHMTRPLDVAVVAFSRFRVDGEPSLVVGGVRGQRHPSMRLSSVELSQALQGWKAPVLMMRVMQEMARHWGVHLVGLDPRWHQLQGWPQRMSGRNRANAIRVQDSYDALWSHFGARHGPPGWMVLPTTSDDSLAATALSPEKRARQIQRADYWLRVSSQLRREMRHAFQRPEPDARQTRATRSMVSEFEVDEPFDPRRPPAQKVQQQEQVSVKKPTLSSRILETGPTSLL